LLDAVNLDCVRGDRLLFRNLSFSVIPGELLHVRGQNGRGKTSLLRILCGLSLPAAGEVRWTGQPIAELGEDYHRDLAYVGHLNGVQGELTARENLDFLCRLGADGSNDDQLTDSLSQLGLARVSRLPAKLLSQGQKRRLALARLLVLPRKLWVLDEPFTALDTHSTSVLATLLQDHAAAGGMAVLTSHQDLPVAAPVRRIDLDAS
jgi:heme exporter protein A